MNQVPEESEAPLLLGVLEGLGKMFIGLVEAWKISEELVEMLEGLGELITATKQCTHTL